MEAIVDRRAGTSGVWYSGRIRQFLEASADAIIGELVRNGASTVRIEQAEAWRAEVDFLRGRIAGLTGTVIFEFSIPRMGRSCRFSWRRTFATLRR